MPANLMQTFDLETLTATLPSLLHESDIESQAKKLKGWLNHLLPVHSMGMTIEDPDHGKNIIVDNMQKRLAAEIENRYREYADSNSLLTSLPVFFTLKDGEAVFFNSIVNIQPAGIDGIAICLKNGDQPFGTFFRAVQELE